MPRPVGVALRHSSFDGRTASFEDLQARLGQLGISAPYMENHPASQPPPKAPGLGVLVKQRKIENENEARRIQREKDLAEGRIDARSAPAEAVQARLATLGVDYDLRTSIREVPKPLPPREEFNPMAAALEARRRAERRAREAARSGKPVDAKSMPSDVFQRYLELRGYASPTSWGPAGRAPPRR